MTITSKNFTVRHHQASDPFNDTVPTPAQPMWASSTPFFALLLNPFICPLPSTATPSPSSPHFLSSCFLAPLSEHSRGRTGHREDAVSRRHDLYGGSPQPHARHTFPTLLWWGGTNRSGEGPALQRTGEVAREERPVPPHSAQERGEQR